MNRQYPAFLICRDRLTCLLSLIAWLEKVGVEEIYLVDNNSTYPPLVEFLNRTHHKVIRLQENLGPRAIWTTPIAEKLAAERFYIVSDPDIIPEPSVPDNVFDYFYDLLKRYPTIDKIGFGLRIDDIPDTYKHKELVLKWEKQFWENKVEEEVYFAAVDTTLMMCRPLSACTQARSLRTGHPYIARHLAWYLDLDNLNEEERYYQKHASPDVSNWNLEEPPLWLNEVLADLEERRRKG